MNFQLFPPQASTSATESDWLFWSLTAASFFICLLVFLPLTYFAIKYRRGRKVNRSLSDFPSWKLEVPWTVIPLVLMMGLFAWSAEVFFRLETPPPGAIEVNVVGKQWMWKLQHAEGAREINELHIPRGQPVKLILTSQDVIHDFFIPAFRMKQDVVPGAYTTEWFTPTRTGRYHIFCAQFCGTSHAAMIGWVYVMEPQDYQRWLSQGSAVPMATRGEQLFHSLGCSGCHSVSSKIHAPPLEGLYGHLVPLETKEFVLADDKYIRDSILMPASQIAAGYQNLMPSFKGHISEEEIMEMIAYLKSIANSPPPEGYPRSLLKDP
jgi:cytochrome c oxidase subunit 2